MMLDVIALAGIMSQDRLGPRSHLESIQEEDSIYPAVYRHEDEDVFAAEPMSEPNATVGGQGDERRDPLPSSVERSERRRRWKRENPKPEPRPPPRPRPPLVDCVMDLAQGKVTLDRFCGQHGATKDEVIQALAQVVVGQAQDIESMAHALEVKDGEIDIWASECEDLKRTKEQHVQRIGRLQADVSFLERDMTQLEDATRGLGPTWQRLRSQGRTYCCAGR
jgi:hypothetical protein